MKYSQKKIIREQKFFFVIGVSFVSEISIQIMFLGALNYKLSCPTLAWRHLPPSYPTPVGGGYYWCHDVVSHCVMCSLLLQGTV